MAKILLIEDDDNTIQAVSDFLGVANNYTIESVNSGKEGLDRLQLYEYDLAIIDWSLPEMTGLQICSTYRAKGGLVPILMLTGKTAVSDKVDGLDAGADDYLTKPFSLPELTARVRALLRRPRETVKEMLQVGNLVFDTKTCKVTKAGKEISLLPKELVLLEFFMQHPDQYFTAETLLNRLWSSESDSTEQAVRQGIVRLRRKIEDEGESLLVTSKGLGYKLVGFGN
jgi:DNA-binding response OmpR family regulator